MSLKVMTEVWESSSTKGGARLVMLALADFANDQGYCYPSVCTLAVKSALSERNVQVILRDLERRGELITMRGAGRGYVNTYWVLPPATMTRLTHEGKNAQNFHPFKELEKRVKNSEKKVQPEAEKAQDDDEKVKPISPRTTKNQEEPSGTIKAELEQKNLEARAKSKPSPEIPLTASRVWQVWLETNKLPDWLEEGAWRRWLTDLDERRARVTTARLEEQLERLRQLSQHESQTDLIARAIAGGWGTFYPARDHTPSSPHRETKLSTNDRYERYR
jgi:Helix-turn-helix domain